MTKVLPLGGKRIVITRARDQAAALADPLAALGATVVVVPTIEIHDPESWRPVDDAIRRLEQFDFLLLTSANGSQRFLARLRACGRDLSSLARLEIGAIGPGTASELAKAGVKVHFVPEEYRAEGLLAWLEGSDLRGRRFLIPRAKVARDLVPQVLEERGATVEVVAAYETVSPEFAEGELQRLLDPAPDLVTFTSSSTALNFSSLLRRHCIVLSEVAAASIGPVTSQTVRQLGWRIVVESPESTLAGLVRAIRDHFTSADHGQGGPPKS